MNDILKNNFSFWCPISKANETMVDPTTGEEIMRLGGIASTADKDSDGEFLDPKGFDIKPLMKSGMVNWHHQAKGQPGAIIGEPTKAEIRPEGLYIETDLYPSSQVAKDVWELAKTLEHDSKSRRLGYSIEGKVVKRKSEDPSNPDYKHIVKAIITGVAITHMPKNPKTFANIIKGEIDDEEEQEEEEDKEEKALDTESGAALKRESLLGANKVVSKSEVFDKLFRDIPGISIKKCNKVFNLIKNISVMAKRKNITEEDITKAYEALGLNVEENDITKGCGGKASVRKSEEDEDEDEIMKKKKVEGEDDDKGEEKEEEEEEEEEEVKKGEDEDEDEDDDEEEEEVEEEVEVKKANILSIEKAIADSNASNVKYFKALGVMLKASADKLEKAEKSIIKAQDRISELNDIIKAQDETISDLSSRIEEFGAGGVVSKALSHAHPVERSFRKGNEDELEKGGDSNDKVISMSRQRNVVAELLDQATFAKGYDEEFSKACTAFEAQHVLPANIIARIKNELGYTIVK